MIKVSVIVPIYNVEDYLSKCLDSLVNQTLTDIEIILVNDGSTDNSLAIAESYSERHDNIILLNKDNGGLSDARNYALPHAKGEYIAFIDSDDYVESEMFARMYELTNNGQKKIVECNFIWEFPRKKVLDEISQYQSLNDYLINGRVVAWNKLYRRSWIEKLQIKFPIGRLYEDQCFFFKIVANLKDISEVAIDMHCEVHYLQRNNSISYRESTKISDIFWIYDDILKYYQQNELNKYHVELEYRFIRNLLGNVLVRKVLRLKDKNVKKKLLNEIKLYIKKNFPNWKKNKYLEMKSKQNIYLKLINPVTYKLFYLI